MRIRRRYELPGVQRTVTPGGKISRRRAVAERLWNETSILSDTRGSSRQMEPTCNKYPLVGNFAEIANPLVGATCTQGFLPGFTLMFSNKFDTPPLSTKPHVSECLRALFRSSRSSSTVPYSTSMVIRWRRRRRISKLRCGPVTLAPCCAAFRKTANRPRSSSPRCEKIATRRLNTRTVKARGVIRTPLDELTTFSYGKVIARRR